MKQDRAFGHLASLWLLIGGAVCISFAPVFVKAIDPATLGPTGIAFWRLLLGAGILLLWGGLTGHSLKISRRMLLWASLAGVIFFADLFVWHRSILHVGAGMATILGNTQVFMTAILSYFVFKEVLTGKFFIAAASGILGVVLLVGVGSEIEMTHDYLLGIVFGLATGIAYANYIITIKYSGAIARRPPMLIFMGWISLMGAVVTFISMIIEQESFLPTDSFDWIHLFGLALVSQAAGWWAISTGLIKVEGSRSGLVLLLQPILATGWGWLIFNERLTLLQLAGATITLAAIYYGSVFGRAKSK